MLSAKYNNPISYRETFQYCVKGRDMIISLNHYNIYFTYRDVKIPNK